MRETDISYNIRAIGRAIDVINVIAQSSEPLKLIEISARSNLNKTTTLRILANLQQAGWVYRLEGDVYSLGFKLLAISQNVASSLCSYKAVRDAIVRVSRDTHETVLFSIWDGENAVCIDKATGTFYIGIIQQINEVTPINAGATGFATLMTMEEKDARKILQTSSFRSYTLKTPVTVESLYNKYDLMQKNKYIVTSGEKDEGIVGVATGIYLSYEKQYGSISIVAPENRVDEERLEFFIKRLLQEKQYLDSII